MSDDLLVSIGGIKFRGYKDQEEYGYWIGKDGWQGWETAPDARADIVARANAHGTTDGPQYLDAREVEQKGFFRARSLTELTRMADRLSGLLADGGAMKLNVQHGGRNSAAMVRRGLSRPDVRTLSDGDLYVGEYELTYRAPDPRRYGPMNYAPKTGTATSIEVSHQGNFPALSTVEIPSAPANYTITSPAGTFTVTGATAGGLHRIDMRTGRVYRNGVHMPGVGRGAVWTTPKGPAEIWALSVPGRVLTPDTFA